MHAATLGARGGGSYSASNPATYPGISLQGTPPTPSPLVCGLCSSSSGLVVRANPLCAWCAFGWRYLCGGWGGPWPPPPPPPLSGRLVLVCEI